MFTSDIPHCFSVFNHVTRTYPKKKEKTVPCHFEMNHFDASLLKNRHLIEFGLTSLSGTDVHKIN